MTEEMPMLSIRAFTVPILAITYIGLANAQAPDFTCHERWSGRDGHTYCEIREFTMPATDLLTVDGRASPTGNIRVTGWDRDDVRVRARVIAWASDSEFARQVADGVVIQSDGVLRAKRNVPPGELWSFVDYDIYAPPLAALSISNRIGSISIVDISGELDLETTSGKIEATGVSNTIAVRSTNGAISVKLGKDSSSGASLNLETTNGAVTLEVPVDFSGELDARSVHGGIHVNVPANLHGERARNWIEATLGGGGPVVRIRTTNGAIRITH